MWADDVFEHAANREHANLESLLAVTWLIFGELPAKDPNQGERKNAGDHKHYRVPGNRILGRVLTEDGFRRRAKLHEEPLPFGIRVLHLEVVRVFTEVLIDEPYDNRCLLGSFLSVLSGLSGFFSKKSEHQKDSSR